MKKGKGVVHRVNVFDSHNDEATDYAILSHRWTEQEVDYDEMDDLARMDQEDRDKIRRRLGYKKIINSCEQAKKDKYEWLWVDTCCIDKRSSAELSEAINSMYRWYENSRICYAYFHDLTDENFPAASDDQRYHHSNGWPEWFSRGWTLQEMIAPRDVRFFNKNWQLIGDKTELARTLAEITRVPEHILTDGLRSNRPCVAQIMSWAANRKTTRVEDKAYSLLGLLDVNMPMLYGEGKKAFHRLQLEIIRTSDDQSIFAWDYEREKGRTCSILADDPSCFGDCSEMEQMGLAELTDELEEDIEDLEGSSINEDRYGVYPITNRGIQIWLLLRRLPDESGSVFEARLPCRPRPSQPPVAIKLASWKYKYYRHFTPLQYESPLKKTLRFKNVCLPYQDLRDVTFQIDDSALTRSGFNYCGAHPPKLAGNTLILTNTDPLCVEVYSDDQANLRLVVGYGKFLGQHWVHLVCEVVSGQPSHWKKYAQEEYKKMQDGRPEYAQCMSSACPQKERYHHVLMKHTSLPGSTQQNIRTSCVVWESSGICAIKIDVFHGFCNVTEEWTGFAIDVGGSSHANHLN